MILFLVYHYLLSYDENIPFVPSVCPEQFSPPEMIGRPGCGVRAPCAGGDRECDGGPHGTHHCAPAVDGAERRLRVRPR